ncbi:MAG: GAF domain-containing protein, partial [Magnetococcales bacterium]|nr:GAF domain-containing protein [Magnetococcales bacterium]
MPDANGAQTSGDNRQGETPAPRFATVAELEREVHRLQFSRDLTREFVRSTGSMKKVMAVVFDRVVEILEAEAGSLWLFDIPSSLNICHLAAGPAKSQILGLRLPKNEGIVGQVIAANKPEVVLDCTRDRRFAVAIDQRSGFRTRSMICVPLADAGHAFGAIQIINKKSGVEKRFTEEDQRLVEDLALSAAIAVRNARLLESESRVREMKILMEISRQISSSLDLNLVLGMVVNMANELVSVSGGAVALLAENRDALSLAMLSGERRIDKADARQINLLQLMERVRQSARAVYVPNVTFYRQQVVTADNPWVDYLESNHLTALWSAPLRDEEGVLGVLWLESQAADFAAGNKSDMLVILASQATVALRNASLYRRIPFATFLAAVSDKGKSWFAGWRRLALAGVVVAGALLALQALPALHWVSGSCGIEVRDGRGVFMPMAGRIEKSFVREGDRVRAGDPLFLLDAVPLRGRLVTLDANLEQLERHLAAASIDPVTLQRLVAERAAVRAERSRIAEEMTHLSLLAPGDGLVLTAHPEGWAGRSL